MTCSVIKSTPPHSGYRFNIRNKNNVFECVTYITKDSFEYKVRRIVLGHSLNKACEIIESLRQRVSAERIVLEKIYDPVLKSLTEDQIWFYRFCDCRNIAPYCHLKYSFGTFEDKGVDTFRTEEKTESVQGISIFHICIDVRFGADADFKSLTDEIVSIHRTPFDYDRDSNCHVLGLNQINLCRDFINDVGSILDTLEVDMLNATFAKV